MTRRGKFRRINCGMPPRHRSLQYSRAGWRLGQDQSDKDRDAPRQHAIDNKAEWRGVQPRKTPVSDDTNLYRVFYSTAPVVQIDKAKHIAPFFFRGQFGRFLKLKRGGVFPL